MVPRHVTFVGYPGFGHLKPTLGIVEELVGRGHRVTYVVTDHYAEQVAATGARVVPYHSLIPDSGLSEAQLDGTTIALEMVRENWAPAGVALAALTDDPPDVVVCDVLVPLTAKVLCRRAGAPLVAGYVIAPMDAQAWADHPKPEVDFESAPFLQLYGKILSEVRPYGIDDLWDVALGGPAPAHNLVYQPRAFLPNGDSFGADHSFVGPCLSLADRHQDWRPPEENRPLLLASLGTSPSDHALELLRTCVRASDGQPWHLVVILGDQLRPGDLGELPANVTAYPWLPHTAVLPYATGFLTHAGMGSLMEAFSFGVPVLMAPDNAEQRSNAEHAVTHGVGAELPAGRDDITADRLRELIIDLLANSSTRRRVAALRAEIEAAGGAVAAADQLLTLASERNVSNPGPGRRRPAAPRR